MEAILKGYYFKGNGGRSHELLYRLTRPLSGLFACQHRDLSRPFTRESETYRACLSCGARRQFDVTIWEMRGQFYH